MDSREPREDHELAAEPAGWLCISPEDGLSEFEHPDIGDPWREPLTDADRDAGWTAVPLFRRPSPVAESTPTDATVVEAERDDTEARRLYNESTANDPHIHCNRFPTWSELTEKTRDYWRARATKES